MVPRRLSDPRSYIRYPNSLYSFLKWKTSKEKKKKELTKRGSRKKAAVEMICRDGGWGRMQEVKRTYVHTHGSTHDKSLSSITQRRQKSCKREERVKWRRKGGKSKRCIGRKEEGGRGEQRRWGGGLFLISQVQKAWQIGFCFHAFSSKGIKCYDIFLHIFNHFPCLLGRGYLWIHAYTTNVWLLALEQRCRWLKISGLKLFVVEFIGHSVCMCAVKCTTLFHSQHLIFFCFVWYVCVYGLTTNIMTIP